MSARVNRVFDNRLSRIASITLVLISVFSLSACQSGSTSVNPAIPPSSVVSAPGTPTTSVPLQPPSTPSNQTPNQDVKWAADGIISPGEYQQANSYGDLDLNWSNDSQYIYIGLKAKTLGWIAIGFGPESLMKNLDCVEGLVKDGKTTLYDMFSSGDFGPHPPDTEQGGTYDILESGGSQANGATVIEFKRKLNTGDSHDKPLAMGTNKIAWAYSVDSLISIKHINRGYGEIVIK